MSERRAMTYREQIDAARILRIREICRELPQACYDFLTHIAVTTSTFTRLAYALDLRTFFSFLHSERLAFAAKEITLMTDDDLAALSTRDIVAYTEYLTYYLKEGTEADAMPQEVVNHELAIKRKLCSIRALYDFLFKEERISGNIAELVPLPKVHEKPIIRLNAKELERLLRTVETGDGLTPRQQAYHQRQVTRDYAMLMLFLGTGIRVSECVGLNIEDVDLENRAFVVTRKGGNQVMLYFNEEVADALSAYLTERKGLEAVPGHEHALFLSSQLKRINIRSVQMLVKKYAAVAAPLKPRISPHKLRSTFATNRYQETGDIYLVADVLGHSSVDTTRKHYADMSDRQRREAATHVHLLNDDTRPAVPAPEASPAAPVTETAPARRRRAAPPPTDEADASEKAGSDPSPRKRRASRTPAENSAAPAQPEADSAAPVRHRRARRPDPEAPASAETPSEAVPEAPEPLVRHRRSRRP